MKRQRGRTQQQRESYLPPTPQFSTTSTTTHRDSDASFTSAQINQPFNKTGAIHWINEYLTSHNFGFTLSLKSLPSSDDLKDLLRFLLSQLHFPVHKLEDDFLSVLKSLNCPHKINKSVLSTPAAPHSFPRILPVILWLVHLAHFTSPPPDHPPSNGVRDDTIMAYAIDSYVAYMKGDDEAVEALDKELAQEMEKVNNVLLEELKVLDDEGNKLELEVNAFKSRPSERETLESQRKDLEADLDKFQGFVAQLQDANSVTARALEGKEKELATKVTEIRQTKAENEELKKRVEAQGINMRDAERMKRELLAVEREISEAEGSRSSWEEKSWDIDSVIGQKYKELEALSIQCNQALRRIKLGGDFQYVLNAKGSTPAEVLGIDYKSTLKPATITFADDAKKNTTAKFEEFIALQQHSKELVARIEAKRNRLAMLQSQIDEGERKLEMIRTEINEFSVQCANEAEKIVENVETEARDLVRRESEAHDTLKAAELKLEQEKRLSEEETQRCAYELFALIDSVSKYKEHVENKISEMQKGLSETTEYIACAYKNTLSDHHNMLSESERNSGKQ